jgi:hypothetical protein
VIQRSQEPSFATESSHAVGIAGKNVGNDFERNVAAQLRVASAVDLTHAACSNGGEDLI